MRSTAAAALLAALALTGLASHTSQPPDAPAGPPTPRPQHVTLSSAPPPPPPAPAPTPDRRRPAAPVVSGELEVAFIDVGQGDATLLFAPDATVLVDTGRHDRSDVVDYLAATGVTTLDVVAVTHPHADHLGQFDRILTGWPVGQVWWSGTVHTTATFDRALAALDADDADYDEPAAGDVMVVGSLLVEFANPSRHADPTDLHDAGLVFRVTYGQTSVLFTGDARAHTERRLLATHRDLLAADVYQVGHHGSATSTTPPFLAAINPTVAVYSAGAGNAYGHPADTVLHRLTQAGAAVYATDVHGTIILTTDGSQLTVTTERQPAADAPRG